MFKVKELEFVDLISAMDYAKSLNEFVSIVGPDFEVCGMFGVDSVVLAQLSVKQLERVQFPTSPQHCFIPGQLKGRAND